MTMFDVLDYILEDKLERCKEDVIDVRFTRDQAEELYGMVHRIVTYDKNMSKKQMTSPKPL